MSYPDFMKHSHEQKAAQIKQAQLEALAHMRQFVKDSKAREKAANSHRDLGGSGQFTRASVPHAPDVFNMRKHLHDDHGVATQVLAPLIGTSLTALHETSHAAGGADHGFEDHG